MRELSHPTILVGIVPFGGRFGQGHREKGLSRGRWGGLVMPRGRHPHNKLTVVTLRHRSPGRHADGNGLYLFMRPSGACSWVQRITINGHRCDLGLGPFPLVSLADARRAAIQNRLTVRAGGDPRVEAARAQGPTVREIYETVTESRRPGWKSKRTEAAWRYGFETYVLPVIGDKRVATVPLEDVRRIVVPHWGGRNSKGYLLRQNLETIFAWAVAENHRLDNPAANLARLLPKVKSHVRHRRASVFAGSRGSGCMAGPSGAGACEAGGALHRADRCPSQ